jgi:hypothetical protein
MMRYKRPDMPPDFPGKVKQAREDAEANIRRLVKAPQEAGKGKKKKKSYEFPDLWKEYKAVFSQAQYGKCGYCEAQVIGGQHGDVEHFAPKGEVWELDENAPGSEIPYLSSVKGRKHIVVCEQGYWWLAYDWSNYLLSCAICNESWKGAIFPVLRKPRKVPPSKRAREVPGMLNPFGDVDPGEHLRFSDLGQVEARDQSAIGLATIRTCGLDRDSLVRNRLEKARSAYRLVQELSNSRTEAERRKVLQEFYELGRAEYVFSGMVRIIFEEQCQVKWSVLEELVGKSDA